MATALILSDVITLFVSFLLMLWIWSFIRSDLQISEYVSLIPILLVFIIAYALTGLYSSGGIGPVEELRLLVLTTTFVFLMLGTLSFWNHSMNLYSRASFLGSWMISITFLPFSRSFFRTVLSQFKMWGEPIALIGEGKEFKEILNYLIKNPKLGMIPVVLLTNDHDIYRAVKGDVKIFSIDQYQEFTVFCRNANWKLILKLKHIRHIIAPRGGKRSEIIGSIYQFKNFLHKSKPNKQVESVAVKPNPLEEIDLVKEELNQNFIKEYNSRRDYYEQWLNIDDPKESDQIIQIMSNKNYKGIIVYPEAVGWEPLQRPQHILREFGKKGYLCFFCQVYGGEFVIEEKFDNVYVITGEKFLLNVLRNKRVVVLCTWMGQTAFIDCLTDKYIWYDILDRLDFFSLYDNDAEHKHWEYVKNANIVTYTAQALKVYVADRKDAILLSNGVNIEDFIVPVLEDLSKWPKSIIPGKKPIIGYYGAIEKWFDKELIKNLAQMHPDWNFIVIGQIGIDLSDINSYPNIYFLGPIPYLELSAYGCKFDIAVIPFIVNDLTNSVSPVKFFEYCALGLPVVSTPILEMRKYSGLECLKLAENTQQFSNMIEGFLFTDHIQKIEETAREFAVLNQWENKTDLIENLLTSSFQGLYCLANVWNFNHVAVFTPTFYDFDGNNFYSGGAERYLIDLAQLFSKRNIKLAIYQYGNFQWVRKFGNIEVISLSQNWVDAKILSVQCVNDFNKSFFIINSKFSWLNFYSSFYEAWPLALHPNIGISHGVFWDSPIHSSDVINAIVQRNDRVVKSANNCDLLISVDTNSANWFQTVDYHKGHNIKVIPNYVDLDLFFPRNDFLESREKIVILYPRRFYEPRGLYLVLDIIDEILVDYPYVEFHFVGRGNEEDTQKILDKIILWKSRVKSYSLMPDEMCKAYQDADISLIPTLYSEVTSLSCLEAMACGNAVIATRVGGLSDLVINDYNGLLIEPNANALKSAICLTIMDHGKMNDYKLRGTQVVKAFSKKRWENQWDEILSSILENYPNQCLSYSSIGVVEIYLSDFFEDGPNNQIIADLLNNNYLIYIRIMNINRELIEMSYGRLQFLTWTESIDSVPILIIADHISQTKIPKLVVCQTSIIG